MSIRFKGKSANEAVVAKLATTEGPWDLTGIAKWIKEHGLSVRPWGKQLIDTTSFKIIQLYTIDVNCGGERWITLQMPDDQWWWLTEKERDDVLKQIT